MHFMVTGWDGSDEGATERRLAARAAHIAEGAKMTAAGQLPYGAALMSEASEGQAPRMIGSVMILNLSSREELDRWLASEPYVVQKVWQKIEIRPVQPGPAFVHLSEPAKPSAI